MSASFEWARRRTRRSIAGFLSGLGLMVALVALGLALMEKLL